MLDPKPNERVAGISPVYIPSRRRPATATTPRIAESERIPYSLVVEPQEAAEYRSRFPAPQPIMVLPENDRGLGYSRQRILEHCRTDKLHRTEWHWQIDDDCAGFRGPGRPARMREALRAVESAVRDSPDRDRIAMAGFRLNVWKPGRKYNQVAWAMLIRTTTGLDYATDGMRQDADFCLQHLAAGWKTLVVTDYAWRAPYEGENAGGSQDFYLAGKQLEAAKWLKSRWPRYVNFVGDAKGDRLQIDWGAFG